MTAIVLPDIDLSTLEDLKKRMPSLRLSDIELPSMARASKQADRAVDRLLGRSRPSIWPVLGAAIGIAAIIATAAALLAWSRKPGWSSRLGRAGSGLPGGNDTGIGVTLASGEASIVGATDTAFGDAAYGMSPGISPFEESQP